MADDDLQVGAAESAPTVSAPAVVLAVPVVDAAKPAEAKSEVAAAPEAPKPDEPIKSLFSQAGKTDDKAPKPDEKAPAKADDKVAAGADGAKAADAKPDDGKAPAAEPAAEVPVEYKFTFPETIKPAPEKVEAFTAFAREHKLAPEAAQKALDMFSDAATAYAKAYDEQALTHQRDTWKKLRSDAVLSIKADAQLGGNNFPLVEKAVARMRDRFASDAPVGSPRYEREMKELNDVMDLTGAGDFKPFWRMMRNISASMDEPKIPAAQPKPSPLNGTRKTNSLYAEKRQ